MKPAPDTGCPSGLAPAENETSAPDPAAFVRKREGGKELELYVRGAKCAGCISKIEKAVTALDGVEEARLNLSTGKLHVRWHGGLPPSRVTSAVAELGYGVTPFDPAAAEAGTSEFAAVKTAEETDADTTTAKLEDLINAFDQLDVPPVEQIRILQLIHQAGNLHARLIVDGIG